MPEPGHDSLRVLASPPPRRPSLFVRPATTPLVSASSPVGHVAISLGQYLGQKTMVFVKLLTEFSTSSACLSM